MIISVNRYVNLKGITGTNKIPINILLDDNTAWFHIVCIHLGKIGIQEGSGYSWRQVFGLTNLTVIYLPCIQKGVSVNLLCHMWLIFPVEMKCGLNAKMQNDHDTTEYLHDETDQKKLENEYHMDKLYEASKRSIKLKSQW